MFERNILAGSLFASCPVHGVNVLEPVQEVHRVAADGTIVSEPPIATFTGTDQVEKAREFIEELYDKALEVLGTLGQPYPDWEWWKDGRLMPCPTDD